MVNGLAYLTPLPSSFNMGGSGKPSPSGQASSSQSHTRSRSNTAPSSSQPSDAYDNSSPWPGSMSASLSSSYPNLDSSFTLLDPPAATHFAPIPGSSRTAPTPTHSYGINAHTASPNFQPSSSHGQHPMWPFMPSQPSAFNGPPRLDMSQELLNTRFHEGSSRLPHGAGPSHRSTTQHSPTMPYSQSPSPVGPHPPTPLDPEELAILEDKRRRNTAASARFRVKKKQKSFNLERTVSDLTLRADELEREASDLRRENAWLKEIVIMKGRGNRFEGQVPHVDESSSDDGTSAESELSESKGKSKAKRKEKKGKGKGKESDGGGRGKRGKRS